MDYTHNRGEKGPRVISSKVLASLISDSYMEGLIATCWLKTPPKKRQGPREAGDHRPNTAAMAESNRPHLRTSMQDQGNKVDPHQCKA